MRIVLLTQYYKPEMGAPQNRLHEMVTGLHENGCDISVITAMPNYPHGKIHNAYKRRFTMTERLGQIFVKRYWLFPSNSKRALPRIFSMLSFAVTSLCSVVYLRRQKPDFIIVESPPLLLGLSGYLLARLSGARLVSNISDIWPLSAKEMGALSDGFMYRILERIEHFIYKKSAFCMGQSDEIVGHLKSHGSSATYLFRNGVDPARFNNRPKLLPVLSEHFTVVYAGLLGYAQGILALCKAIDFSRLGVEFHIYGAGGEQEAIRQFLETNPDRGIIFHGAVSREEIPGVLQQANATLIPLIKNIYGAVPSKIYESMAAGVPILFSGDGEGASIVRDNEVGWVCPPANYEYLTQSLKRLVRHPEEVDEKTKNCRKAAENKFNRPRQIRALYCYLESVL